MTAMTHRQKPTLDPTNTTVQDSDHLRSAARLVILASTLFTLLAASAPVRSQSCLVPVTPQPTPPLLLSGTTCGLERLPFLPCSNQVNNPGPNYVIQFVLHNPAGNLTIEGDGQFDPAMYLFSGHENCEFAPCLSAGDESNPLPLTGLPAGPYLLIIAASANEPDGACGHFTLRGDEEFFAGEAEYIFADGFN